MSEHKDNYDAIMGLPIVKKLVDKNRKLREKNRVLKTLLYNFSKVIDLKYSCDDIQPSKRKPLRKTCSGSCTRPCSSPSVPSVPFNDVTFTCTFNNEEEEEEEEEDNDSVCDVNCAVNGDAIPNIHLILEDEDEDEDEVVIIKHDKKDVVIKVEKIDNVATGEVEAEEEVEEEEVEEEEVEEEEVEEEEVEEEEVVEEVEEEEESVFEITIKGKSYYTNNEKNGKIYAITADEDVGDEIGKFVDSNAVFNKK